MSEASLGLIVVGGLAGILVLAIGILRVLNRRAAPRARHHRPFDPSYQPQTAKDAAAQRGYGGGGGGGGIV